MDEEKPSYCHLLPAGPVISMIGPTFVGNIQRKNIRATNRFFDRRLSMIYAILYLARMGLPMISLACHPERHAKDLAGNTGSAGPQMIIDPFRRDPSLTVQDDNGLCLSAWASSI
jgi:hypothetical protein